MRFLVIAAWPRPRPLDWALCAVLALGLMIALPRLGNAQRISYTIIPSAEYVTWDSDLAIDDDWLAGGRLALRFGPYVELAPFYLTRRGLDLDADRADDVFGVPTAGLSPDVEHIGAKVQANFGHRGLIPFLRLGGGVIRFDPGNGPRRDRVAVSYGGGLRFGLTWLQGEIFAEQLSFRLEPSRLFAPGTPTTGQAPQHNNVSYGAALMVPLSEVDPDAPVEGIRGTSAPLEPFVGRLNYAGGFGLEDQDLFGVRAGIDFSQLFGVRGFYWRGADDGFSETTEISGYGAEAQFNLNAGPGVSPFLIVGGGRIDYGSGFNVPAGGVADDQTAVILGAGATFQLWNRVGLNLAWRDYIMSIDQPIEQAGDPDDLTHNTVLTGGLTIAIGGSSVDLEEERARTQRELREARAQIQRLREQRALRTRADSARWEQLMARLDSLGEDTTVITRDLARDTTPTGVIADATTDSIMQLMQSGTRLVVAPAPIQGEVIFRYGLPPASPRRTTTGRPGDERAAEEQLSLEAIRAVVREEIQADSTRQRQMAVTPPQPTVPAQPPQQPTPPVPPQPQQVQPQPVQPQQMPRTDTTIVQLPEGTLSAREFDARLSEMERRLTERLEALEGRLRAQAAQAPAPTTRQEAVTQRESPGQVQEPSRSLFARLGDFQTRDLRPFVGTTLGDDETQFVLDARANLGPLRPDSPFQLWPEVALTFGNGERSLLALANLQYPVPFLGSGNPFQPYLIGGLGIFSETGVALNTALGANYDIRQGRGSPLYAFLEWQGINLFDYSRLLVGLSVGR